MSGKIKIISSVLTLALAIIPSASYSDTQLGKPCDPPKKDYVTSHPEFNRVLLENDRIRVFEYILEAGEKEGWHAHPDMLLYVVEGGTILAEFETGDDAEFIEIKGEAKYFDAGPKHTAENISDERIVLIITEFKH